MPALLATTAQTIPNVFKEQNTNPAGLTETEASLRLKQFGPNQITGQEIRWWQILARQFNSPFIFLLVSAAALSIALGEKTDGIIILCFIVINATLGFIQEWHSEKSLKLLKQFVVPQARVRRNGKEILIPSKNIVPGDILIVEAGDSIAADIRFFECTDLSVDETVLTGESVSVSKKSDTLKTAASENYQAANGGFSGTTVVCGKGVGIVVATGKNSVLGDITRLTVETHHQSSFEKGISKFSTFILRMILVILVLLFVVNLIIKGHDTNIFELVLFSIALAVSVVPEALPVVTTIALSKGALKMAKHKVVVKRLSAVEDLGSIEVLCTDKTGTLTENKLVVDKIEGENRAVFLGALASSFLGEHKRDANNSFDLALWDKLSSTERAEFSAYKKIGEIPFDPNRRRNSVLVKTKTNCTLIVRGAPEVVIDLCVGITAEKKKTLFSWMADEGRRGNRAIAVAIKKEKAPGECCTLEDEKDLQLVGLVSFVDPIKSTAQAAISHAKELGVKIKIITGDSREVAEAVGRTVGLVQTSAQVATGADLENLKSERERVELAESVTVFARVSPQQKLMIIDLLQSKYEVGFLGEGINDAPALKMANVGIVVDSAADIAREAADIVLLKKSLNVIVEGIQDGRAIFANTVKYIKATLVSNFGNFYAIAVASLLIPYLPMLPVQILLLNLLSDFPMIAIATDSVDASELRRPRSYNVRGVVLISLILGAVSTVFDFIFFAIFNKHDPAILQTNWFIGSVLTELVLIFSIRTRGLFIKGKRPPLGLSVLSVAAFLGAIALPYWRPSQKVFGFYPPTAEHLLTVLAVVTAYFVVNESVKLLYYKYFKEKEPVSALA